MRSTLGFTLVEIMVVIALVGSLVVFGFFGLLLVRGCNKVTNEGLKPTVERVWFGPQQEQTGEQ